MQEVKEGIPQLPQISCLRFNKATIVCSSNHCKQNAFICSKQDCQHCVGKHQTCMRYKITSLIDQISKKKQTITPEVKKAIQTLEKIYDQAIQKLSIQKELISSRVQLFGLNDYEIKFIKKLQDGLSNQIKGKLVLNIIKNLKSKKEFKATDQSITKFWKKREEDFDSIFQRLKNITYKNPNLLQSQIVDDMQVINDFFKQPIVSSDLLFRASENNFSVQTFHKKCDGIKNTLLLFKTEYGYVAGGFTPLVWGTGGNYQRDNERKTFIFSVTNKQKYSLKMLQYTIYCNAGYGPTFGGGHDIYISNSSNTNRSSYCNVPHSYNVDNNDLTIKRAKYADSDSQQQDEYQSQISQEQISEKKYSKKSAAIVFNSNVLNPRNFIGSTSDYYTTIIEWEVFKLEF